MPLTLPLTLPLQIGLRYTWAKRRNTFISFVSLFAFLGMALGVFALIVVLSVMNGFDQELKDRILKVIPHGFIHAATPQQEWQPLAQQLPGQFSIKGASPYVSGFGMVTYEGSVHGIEIQGIEPSLEPTVSTLDQSMLLGELKALQPGEYGIILGRLLARYLGVIPGDKVHITLADVSITPAGIFPRSRRFTVVGVFEAGAQIDQTLVLMHITDAQKLLRKPAPDGLRLKFNDIFQAPHQLKQLQTQLGPQYTVQDWSETQGSIFQAIQMEKTVVGLLLSIIVAVAAFNIVTSLIMMITEKRSDIAVLRTMGMSARGVVGIFMAQGTLIGVVGIVIGAVLGIVIAIYIADIIAYVEQLFNAQIFDPSVYFVTRMPSYLMWSDVFWVCLSAFIISVLATCYPAYRASQIAPAEALRYNV